MGRPRKVSVHPEIKKALGFDETETDDQVISVMREARRWACKPCWELKYCPYGPLVEESPLLPTTRDEAENHHSYLKNCLTTGVLGDGSPLDDNRRELFECWVAEFDPDSHPNEIPDILLELRCRIFGHICPVIFVAENISETSSVRRRTRSIPAPIKMRVARRDNYMCQECKRMLSDFDIEFDHIIPLSKGGHSSEENLRVTCWDCNHDKTDAYDPSEH
jgi:hypothetical protein